MVLTLDLETSIFNKGNPHDTRNFIVSHHTKTDSDATICSFYTDADFIGLIREGLANASLLVGCNIKFDLAHLHNLNLRPRGDCRIWDVALAEFILSGQTSAFPSLNELAERYGLGAKEPVVAEYWAKGIGTEAVPREIVEEYGNHDVDLTYSVYVAQRTDPRMTPELNKLILLCGLDLLVLLEMEGNGFKYNVEGSRARAATLGTELEGIQQELEAFSPVQFNWDSGDQLSCFLYGGSYEQDIYQPVNKVYKSGPKKGLEYVQNSFVRTDTHRFGGFFTPIKGTALAKSTAERPFYSTAEDVLTKLKPRNKDGRRIIHLLRRRSTIVKLIGTYLNAMPELLAEMHWADTLIHGQFNQTIARTGRLSSSKPNMQNAPEEVDEFFVSRF